MEEKPTEEPFTPVFPPAGGDGGEFVHCRKQYGGWYLTGSPQNSMHFVHLVI